MISEDKTIMERVKKERAEILEQMKTGEVTEEMVKQEIMLVGNKTDKVHSNSQSN